MLRPRIIPCLLVHEGGLVKTQRFRDPKYVGDPINAIKIFNEKEADELMVLDIDAAILGAEPNYRLIAQFAAECRMPLCYGGGIGSVEQAKRVIRLGVEKVAISSAALRNPKLVSAVAAEIGSQSVVIVLDVKRGMFGKYEVFTHNGRNGTGRTPVQAAMEVEQLGAGEIVINSIDQDGQMTGYDLHIANKLRNSVGLPVTMLGGAGALSDIDKLFNTSKVSGAAAGSLFVFKGAYRAVLINYPSPEQKNEIAKQVFRQTEPASDFS